MSSGKWKSLSLSSNLLPSKSFRVRGSQVVIDRFIYWCALRYVSINRMLCTRNVIMSFNMSNENMGVVDLPECLASAYPYNTWLSIYKLRESLALHEYSNGVCVVRVMESGDVNNFTRLYTIRASHGPKMILGFRESGKPIMEVKDHLIGRGTLVVYDPNSEKFNDLEICGTGDFLFVNSYMETLLLHDRSDCSSN